MKLDPFMREVMKYVKKRRERVHKACQKIASTKDFSFYFKRNGRVNKPYRIGRNSGVTKVKRGLMPAI